MAGYNIHFLLPDIYADPILSARKESDFVHQSQNHRRCKYKERSCLPFSAEIKPVLKPEYWSRFWSRGNDRRPEDSRN